jgi:hypothetical protein
MAEGQEGTVCAPVAGIKKHISLGCHAPKNNARSVKREW